MISRRLLRIKVVHILYAHYRNEGQSIQHAEKELMLSIEKAYDLYHYLFSLIVEVADYASERIEIAKNKRRPTKADLNPNTRFIDNPLIEQIRYNNQLNRHLERTKLHWKNDSELVKKLFQRFQEAPDYIAFMESEEEPDYEASRKLLVKLFNKEIMHCLDLYQILEDQSIYWNDDIEFVINMIAKTIKRMEPEDNPRTPLMDMFRDDEDRDFVLRLLRKSMLQAKAHDDLIIDQIKNWDIDRIIFMDKLLIRLAITEIVEFPSVPVKVSINEYLEIAKLYSSQKSNVFINGVLDKLITKLREEESINKQGRGLIGEA